MYARSRSPFEQEGLYVSYVGWWFEGKLKKFAAFMYQDTGLIAGIFVGFSGVFCTLSVVLIFDQGPSTSHRHAVS